MTTRCVVAYYNEIEPYAAAWLRNLISAKLIAPGEVDERSIADVSASDLKGFTQWHLFAGIGGWSAALRLARWFDHESVLTASVPCQPFSAAGKRGGHGDERNLWPHALRLIRELRPPTCFGEQVNAAVGHGWLDGIWDDLEREGYAFAAVDLPACSVGAPHIRQRLFWVADSGYTERGKGDRSCDSDGRYLSQREGEESSVESRKRGEIIRLAHAEVATPGTSDDVHARESYPRDGVGMGNSLRPRLEERPSESGNDGAEREATERASGDAGGVGDANRDGTERAGRTQRIADATGTPWADAIWLPCLDGKARRTQQRIRFLADGISGIMAASGSSQEPEDQMNVASASATADEIVPDMRNSIRSPEVREGSRGRLTLQGEKILQSLLREHENQSEREGNAGESPQADRADLRAVWKRAASSRSPSGRESAEQRPVEPQDIVRHLSQAMALDAWPGAIEESVGLRHLLIAFAQVGLLPEALPAVPQVWRSAPQQARQLVGQLLCARGFVWSPLSPLSHGEPARANKLRALGNAIVPPLAAAFVRAYMEARGLC